MPLPAWSITDSFWLPPHPPLSPPPTCPPQGADLSDRGAIRDPEPRIGLAQQRPLRYNPEPPGPHVRQKLRVLQVGFEHRTVVDAGQAWVVSKM